MINAPTINSFVSIVITYYERAYQLDFTLQSFRFQRYQDYEVIIVDDGSVKEPLIASEWSSRYPEIEIHIVNIATEEKWYSNPCIPFNIGLDRARGDIIILQNAECFHRDNILEHARIHVDDYRYLTYGCFALGEKSTRALWSTGFVSETVASMITPNVINGRTGWFNHSVYRPNAFHFTAAMTRKSMDSLQGFDTRYARGVTYDDDEFLFRVRRMGLIVDIVDDCVVIHQWHSDSPGGTGFRIKRFRNRLILNWVTQREKHIGDHQWTYQVIRYLYPLLYLFYRFFHGQQDY
jgi:glycosyltransferase involved in cell wall biosynthesis